MKSPNSIAKRKRKTTTKIAVSVIIPCKNEKGTIARCIAAMPKFSGATELIFVDGHSTDGTWELLVELAKHKPMLRLLQQRGTGKWDAVLLGFSQAKGNIVMIYDADMSVPITALTFFYRAVLRYPDALMIGSRFIYPQERGAMRLLNHTGNIAFSRIFSGMLRTRITDTLCGTKACTRNRLQHILRATETFRMHDPYGDFTLLLGAAKLRMQIREIPIQYRARVYGTTKISRFRDGFRLLGVLWYAIKDFRTHRLSNIS